MVHQVGEADDSIKPGVKRSAAEPQDQTVTNEQPAKWATDVFPISRRDVTETMLSPASRARKKYLTRFLGLTPEGGVPSRASRLGCEALLLTPASRVSERLRRNGLDQWTYWNSTSDVSCLQRAFLDRSLIAPSLLEGERGDLKSLTLTKSYMGCPRTLDALEAFISLRRQIQTCKQVLPGAEQDWHDCQM